MDSYSRGGSSGGSSFLQSRFFFIKIFPLICNLEQDSCCLERNTGLLLLLHPYGLCLGESSALQDWVEISFLQLGCSTSHMSGTLKESGDYDVNTGCNSEFPNNCSCPVSRMQPICSKDDLTNFYSPCHAGCKQLQAFQAPTQMQVRD